MIDKNERGAQRHPRFVLNAGMSLQKINEKLLLLQVTNAAHVLVVNRPHRSQLARRQDVVKMIDQLLLGDVRLERRRNRLRIEIAKISDQREQVLILVLKVREP